MILGAVFSGILVASAFTDPGDPLNTPLLKNTALRKHRLRLLEYFYLSEPIFEKGMQRNTFQ